MKVFGVSWFVCEDIHMQISQTNLHVHMLIEWDPMSFSWQPGGSQRDEVVDVCNWRLHCDWMRMNRSINLVTDLQLQVLLDKFPLLVHKIFTTGLGGSRTVLYWKWADICYKVCRPHPALLCSILWYCIYSHSSELFSNNKQQPDVLFSMAVTQIALCIFGRDPL